MGPITRGSQGPQTYLTFYSVEIFGNYTKIKTQVRLGFKANATFTKFQNLCFYR